MSSGISNIKIRREWRQFITNDGDYLRIQRLASGMMEISMYHDDMIWRVEIDRQWLDETLAREIDPVKLPSTGTASVARLEMQVDAYRGSLDRQGNRIAILEKKFDVIKRLIDKLSEL